jgi:hypothetical protein
VVSLFKEIRGFFSWLGAVLSVFFRSHPFLTPALIASRVVASVTRLLAFFIPLKVLLLVASPGVPRYFQFFITPEHRNEWIVILSFSAVGAYLLTLALDRLADWWSEIGSGELLRRSSVLSVIGDQRRVAKRYYASFSNLTAHMFLSAVIFGVGAYLYPSLYLFLGALIFLQLVITWLALRAVDPLEVRGFGGYVLQRTNNYVGHLETIGFLAAFGFMVTDFVVFDGVNILLAILSFLMTRRLLDALNSVTTEAVVLTRQRQRIDPLIFLERRHVKRPPGSQLKLNRYFQVAERRERLRRTLLVAGYADIVKVESHWLDSGRAGSFAFEVRAFSSDGTARFVGLERVVASRSRQPLENESLIIESLGSRELKAPPVLLEYEVGEFQCRLFDLQGASAVTQRDWKERHQPQVMLHLWGIDPGEELRRIFELSKPYIFERIGSDRLEALEVAADTEAKVAILQAFRLELPTLQSLLKSLPTFPFNKSLGPGAIYERPDGDLYILDWSRWSLEPVGVGMEPEAVDEDLVQELESKLGARKWRGAMPTVPQLKLAGLMFAFEDQLINRARFNEALSLAERMLAHLKNEGGDLDKVSAASGTVSSA